MIKNILILLFAALFFLGCPDDEPCTTCPTPIDTTSHTFTWQTFTWGGGGASSINDVAIINEENDIWVVGDINLPDSVGQDSLGHNPPFGAAHWNGTGWKLFRLPAIVSPTYTEYLPVRGVVAFSPTDIWLASGGGVHRFNGNVITQSYWLKTFPGNNGILNENQSVEKLWGTSGNNLYAIGKQGGLAWFNGSVWQKVESGTTNYISDIYGARNSKTDEWEILAVAEQSDTLPFQTQLLHIQGVSVSTVETFPEIYFSVWFVPGERYYLAGDGIMWKNKLSGGTWNYNPMGTITQYGTGCIRGTGLNDIFTTGSFFEVVHFNGSNWYNYSNEIQSGLGTFGRVSLQKNIMVTGGYFNQDAIVLIGKR